jgi:hypothetical protein
MPILKIFAGIVVAGVLLIAALFVGARFHDGPLSMIPGGPLSSGAIVSEAVDDWGFAETVELVEFQLDSDETPRTDWCAFGRRYVVLRAERRGVLNGDFEGREPRRNRN